MPILGTIAKRCSPSTKGEAKASTIFSATAKASSGNALNHKLIAADTRNGIGFHDAARQAVRGGLQE